MSSRGLFAILSFCIYNTSHFLGGTKSSQENALIFLYTKLGLGLCC